MTAEQPKCLLPILGRPLIEWQIDEFIKAGIDQIAVVVGYRADLMEQFLFDRYGSERITLIHNPSFASSDNLISCWTARHAMNEDFLLVNGDTLVSSSVVTLLLEQPVRPVTVMIDRKPCYDADDMKVSLQGERLVDIGKDLAPDKTNGESVGLILFQGDGPRIFQESLEKAVARDSSARKKWYLSVIRDMCLVMPIWTCSLDGRAWCEVDYPADMKDAESVVATWSSVGEATVLCRRA
jgi:choline kinase